MMLSTFELLVCINQIFYCYGFLPQIATNYHRKSGKGLSIGFLFALFNTMAALLYYFLCLPFPLSYRVSIFFQLLAVVVWLGQRLYYEPLRESRTPFMLFLLNGGAVLALLPLAQQNPEQFGHAAGWVGVGLLFVCRLPQMVKIFRERSVRGFNYGFVALLGVASVMELVIVFMYQLPTQTLMTSGFSLFCFLVFTYQFWLYKWAKR